MCVCVGGVDCGGSFCLFVIQSFTYMVLPVCACKIVQLHHVIHLMQTSLSTDNLHLLSGNHELFLLDKAIRCFDPYYAAVHSAVSLCRNLVPDITPFVNFMREFECIAVMFSWTDHGNYLLHVYFS